MAKSTFFPSATAESTGISSGAIREFVTALDRDIRDMHSVLLLRRGSVLAEGYWAPYGVDDPHVLYSLSKSFTSTAIGLLVAKGRLSVDDRVVGFFPENTPFNASENLRSMRVRDLLTMTTGQAVEPNRATFPAGATWVEGFLSSPVEFPPGTHFVYNSMATYMLSAIAQKLSGQQIVDYLKPRLFDPLGIDNPRWEVSPEGINVGGWGLNITTRDIARFGQLYLKQGICNGKQLVPASWVADATSSLVPNAPNDNPDWAQGYGYQFWQCRHHAYRGDGAFGQFCIVFPEHEAVLAMTAGVSNMQSVLDVVWKYLLPSFTANPLPENADGHEALSQKVNGLLLRPASGSPTSPRATDLSGRTYQLDLNPSGLKKMRFTFGSSGDSVTVDAADGPRIIPCGYGAWQRSVGGLMPDRILGISKVSREKIATSAAWSDQNTFVILMASYETPYCHTLTCHFDGDDLVVDQSMNVAFGATELAQIRGRMA